MQYHHCLEVIHFWILIILTHLTETNILLTNRQVHKKSVDLSALIMWEKKSYHYIIHTGGRETSEFCGHRFFVDLQKPKPFYDQSASKEKGGKWHFTFQWKGSGRRASLHYKTCPRGKTSTGSLRECLWVWVWIWWHHVWQRSTDVLRVVRHGWWLRCWCGSYVSWRTVR